MTSRAHRFLALFLFASVGFGGAAIAGAGHHADDAHGESEHLLQSMKDMHRSHTHEHSFQAMEEMDPEMMVTMVGLMREIGLALPPMDAERGRELFLNKGCVACHSVNGVGGDLGPALDAGEMPSPMNAFEFAARMWRGAAAMTALQEAELGAVIELSGQDLADIVAFAHDANEQAELSNDQVPQRFRKMLAED